MIVKIQPVIIINIVNVTGTIFGDMRQKYMTTATYKGSVVATKNILSKNISMNRKLLIELKRMKDLQHDHLVR